MLEITSGTVQYQACARAFEGLLGKWTGGEGVCYIGYPIFSTIDGRIPIDALIIIPQKGVVVVNFVEGTSLPSDYKEAMDDSYMKLQSKLQGCKVLVEGRRLAVAINVATYAPAVASPAQYADYPVCNDSSFIEYLEGLPSDELSEKKYKQLLSALQSITMLRAGLRKRLPSNPTSRGAVVQRLEKSISTLDHTQSRAVIETVDGVQRIRGLAGSGKTVVLALKAAYLHAQHPEWKICVTFHSRSLKEQFKRLITGFVIESTGSEPDWDNLRILHAWGSGLGAREGVYYNYCTGKGVVPFDYGTAKSKYGMLNAFGGACKVAIEAIGEELEVYDAILVDEAQDLPVEFLRICYRILKVPKRLVYAYDELQSLTQLSLPPPSEIFGQNKDGEPNVTIKSASQDIVLEVCYRNSRPILTCAHALGFGIYRLQNPRTHTGLIQMFEDKRLWEEVGYSVESGQLDDGKDVVLSRTPKTSPTFLEEEIEIDDMILFRKFDDEAGQVEWVAKEIAKNIQEEELRADDIMVINPDPLSTRIKTGVLRAKLLDMGINVHLVGVDTAPDVFFGTDEASVAFSGIFRAKGNEAAMVYVINAQDCYGSFIQLSTVRNRLFTAITRSKAWVRVLGIGDNMQLLIDEFEKVKNSGFKLKFNYPNAELRQQLKIVNRDKSFESYQKIKDAERTVGDIIEALKSGELHKDDFSAEVLEQLRTIIER